MSTQVTNTSDTNENSGDVFNTSAPDNSIEYTAKLAKQHFGINVVKAELLACERDQIFLLTDDTGTNFVWRFTHPAEDRLVSNFQTQAMLHITEQAPEIPIPRIIKSLNGESETIVTMECGQESVIRVISFLSGIPMTKAGVCSTALRQNMAKTLAELDIALQGFSHKAQHNKLLWDTQHVLDLRKLLVNVQDESLRAIAAQVLDNFEQFVVPVLPSLRAQVIHNDLNYSNAMVENADSTELAGIIDFGDIVYAPLIQELGVAGAYHLLDTEQPLENVVQLVATYHKTIALKANELDVLFDFIITRCVMTLLITEWRAAMYPENRDYILRNQVASVKGLKRLMKLGRVAGREILYQACDL